MHTESSHFDHHIVCGFGRIGETLCRRLSHAGEPFVAVDIDRERLARAREQCGWYCVVGDAMLDDVLIQAGIRRATTLSCFLPTDVSNAFVALSARMLAPNLWIIACVRRPGVCKQLRSAGADHIIDAYERELKKRAQTIVELIHKRQSSWLARLPN